MRILGGITIVLTLALISAFCSQATAAPASELLQKGLYAEEVEGNIDSAIKTYGEVIKKTDAPRNHIAQALYRQGMCYLRIKDEQAAKTALEKLVNEYADQTEIVQKAQAALDDLMNFDPAALMPPGTLIYVELGSPGKQVETILNMLKGTPYERDFVDGFYLIFSGLFKKVVILTNLNSPKDIAEAVEWAQDYLVKSVWKIEDVVKRVKEKLGE